MKSAAVMTYCKDSGKPRTDHFATGLDEYAGRTPEDAATTEIAVHNAMRTIEGLMREDRKRRARAGLPELVLPDELASAQAAPGRRSRGARRTRAASAWRPGPVHGAWAAAFVSVLLWPRVMLIALFVLFVACLVGVALFGPEMLERMRERVMWRPGRRARARAARKAAAGDAMSARRTGSPERLRDQRG